jgi:hypothetical protein
MATAAVTYIARMVTPPSATLKTLINKTFVDIGPTKLAKLLALILPMHNSADSLLNWISSNFNATLVNAPSFTPGYGWNINGTTQYLRTNLVPSVNGGTVWTLNSASFMVIYKTATDKAGYEMTGSWDATQTKRVQILRPNNYYNNYAAGINSSAVAAVSTEKISGIYLALRTASNVLKLMVNKVLKINTNTASVAVATIEPYVGAMNANGVASYFENDPIGGYMLGGGFTDQEASDFTDVIQYFINNVQAAI